MWDTIQDVHSIIYAYAGPLTTYLTGGACCDTDIIWHDALRKGWCGDFALLPPKTITYDDCRSISFRATYAHVKNYIQSCVRGGISRRVVLTHIRAAAMENVWWDEIDIADPRVLAEAAVGGHTDLLQSLLRDHDVDATSLYSAPSWDGLQTTTPTDRAMAKAAAHGRLHVLEWLHVLGKNECSKTAMDLAATNGHLHTVQWLATHRREGGSCAAVDGAVANGHYKVAAFLRAHLRLDASASALRKMIEADNIDAVRYLHQACNAPCPSHLMDQAAAGGHLKIIQYLHTHYDDVCSTNAMDFAARNGHLETMQWLHRHCNGGCSRRAMDLAATNGHLRVVRFLLDARSEGCPVSAAARAASAGHLNVVDYLIKKRPQSFRVTQKASHWWRHTMARWWGSLEA